MQVNLRLESIFILTQCQHGDKNRGVSPKFYTAREVAEHAGISRQTLYAWISKGRIKGPAVVKAAGVRLWTDSELSEVLKVKPRTYPRKRKARRRR
jgi:excisionase family DNA binding protein